MSEIDGGNTECEQRCKVTGTLILKTGVQAQQPSKDMDGHEYCRENLSLHDSAAEMDSSQNGYNLSIQETGKGDQEEYKVSLGT